MIKWPHFARRALFRLAGGALVVPSAMLALPAGAQTSPAERDRRVWTSPFDRTRVWGYVDKHSVNPGETFDMMLSTGPARDEVRGRIEFFRVGHHPGGQKLVWTSSEVIVSHQAVSQTASSVGANWSPAIGDIDTRDWPPGYYSADFVETGTGVRDIQRAQIIVLNPRRSGAVLLRLGTNTYQAYNAWGGHSLYPSEDEEARGHMVSFDRPTIPGFFEYEVYLARWLEELGARDGFDVDYASNFDVHRDPTLVENYPLVISGSHDEYWSKEEFDAFERRIFRLGGNTAFFGANAAYFQVRYIDVNRPPDGPHLGRQLLCYKSFNDPIARRDTAIDGHLLVTARFREGARRPESMLMGVAFQNWFSPASGATYPYHVTCTDMPFFEGTGWKAGDMAANVVGYEWDDRDPAGDGHRLWGDRSCNKPIPAERLKVLFEGTPVAENGQTGRAEAVYFESPAGAKVFSAGSTRWAWGLGKPGFENPAFGRFNQNLIRALIVRS